MSAVDTPPRAGTPAETRGPLDYAPPRRPIALDPWHGSKVALRLRQLAAFAIVIGAWELASGPLVNPFFIGTPGGTFEQLWEWAGDGTLTEHIGATFVDSTLGFLIGAAWGVALGIVFGLSERSRRAIEPFVKGGYTVPKIALAPVLVAALGFGHAPKIVLAAISAAFIMLRATTAGFREVGPAQLAQARVMGATRWQLIRKIILPNLATPILLGVELAYPYAFHGTVIAEFVASGRGLGYLLQVQFGVYNIDGIFAALVAIMLVVGGALGLIKLLIRRTPIRHLLWQI